jgi:hypothetical protein
MRRGVAGRRNLPYKQVIRRFDSGPARVMLG